MRAEERFLEQPTAFWAHVRLVSEARGYVVRGEPVVRAHEIGDIIEALEKNDLRTDHVVDDGGEATNLGRDLVDYFAYRAEVLNDFVEPRLMDLERATEVFEDLYERLDPDCHIPQNKQRGEKSGPNYFTGIINMLIECHSEEMPVDYNPRELTKLTLDGVPVGTMSRWIDGACPGPVNPVAVWEIKEHYHTTTFGSRVAAGVYESLLDGLELRELEEREGVEVDHLFMMDAHRTWWEDGRSYLCRVVDMVNMGYVDEALFGYEVVERLPEIVPTWVEKYRQRPDVMEDDENAEQGELSLEDDE